MENSISLKEYISITRSGSWVGGNCTLCYPIDIWDLIFKPVKNSKPSSLHTFDILSYMGEPYILCNYQAGGGEEHSYRMWFSDVVKDKIKEFERNKKIDTLLEYGN